MHSYQGLNLKTRITPATPPPTPNPWALVFGVPELLVADNGLDLTAYAVADSCYAAGIDLMFTPVRAPWFKGVVERFGGTTNTRFVHRLPGTTLGRQTSREDYNGAEHASITYEQFHYLLDQYLSTIHNASPIRTKGPTPLEALRRGFLETPPRLPGSEEEFAGLLALTKERVLTKDGVLFLGLQYQNEILQRLWNHVPKGTRLTLKVNPENLQIIRVVHPINSELIPVECTAPLRWPLSMPYHLAVRGHARKLNLDPANMKQLATAQERFMQKMNEFETSNKAALRRKQAAFTRESQARDVDEAQADELPIHVDSSTASLDALLEQL